MLRRGSDGFGRCAHSVTNLWRVEKTRPREYWPLMRHRCLIRETGGVTVAVRRFADLAATVLAQPGPVRLVGVDGCGGSGKTTFAGQLADAAGGCPVVHTD